MEKSNTCPDCQQAINAKDNSGHLQGCRYDIPFDDKRLMEIAEHGCLDISDINRLAQLLRDTLPTPLFLALCATLNSATDSLVDALDSQAEIIAPELFSIPDDGKPFEVVGIPEISSGALMSATLSAMEAEQIQEGVCSRCAQKSINLRRLDNQTTRRWGYSDMNAYCPSCFVSLQDE